MKKTGFDLPIAIKGWKDIYNAWKKVILCQLTYKRPLTSREIRKWSGMRRTTVDTVLQQMIEEGLAYRDETGNYDYPFYTIYVEKALKYITVVPEEDYPEHEYNISLYLEFLKSGDELAEQARNAGLKQDEDIEEYIIDRITKTVDREYNKPYKPPKKVDRVSKITLREQYEELEQQGIVAKVIRGEMSISEYEQLLQNR